MHREQVAGAWKQTGELLGEIMNSPGHPSRDAYEKAVKSAEMHNPWFTRKQVENAFNGIIRLLEPAALENWLERYPDTPVKSRQIGVIMAGNIPMAGFHDMLTVSLSGHRLLAKRSSSDFSLLPFVADLLFHFLPGMREKIIFTDQLKQHEAVIATGSNNTSRYFEYYFGKLPHLFRKNRNAAAVISGKENEYDFILLGKDVFTYFGLGCRNVSKLFVPENYNFDEFYQGMNHYADVMDHNKYMNNHDYHQSLFLLNRQTFLTNNFLIVREEQSLASPVAVLHYEYYSDEDDLRQKLSRHENELQCVVSRNGKIPFGQSQFPAVDDYADGVDTMEFLLSV